MKIVLGSAFLLAAALCSSTSSSSTTSSSSSTTSSSPSSFNEINSAYEINDLMQKLHVTPQGENGPFSSAEVPSAESDLTSDANVPPAKPSPGTIGATLSSFSASINMDEDTKETVSAESTMIQEDEKDSSDDSYVPPSGSEGSSDVSDKEKGSGKEKDSSESVDSSNDGDKSDSKSSSEHGTEKVEKDEKANVPNAPNVSDASDTSDEQKEASSDSSQRNDQQETEESSSDSVNPFKGIFDPPTEEKNPIFEGNQEQQNQNQNQEDSTEESSSGSRSSEEQSSSEERQAGSRPANQLAPKGITRVTRGFRVPHLLLSGAVGATIAVAICYYIDPAAATQVYNTFTSNTYANMQSFQDSCTALGGHIGEFANHAGATISEFIQDSSNYGFPQITGGQQFWPPHQHQQGATAPIVPK